MKGHKTTRRAGLGGTGTTILHLETLIFVRDVWFDVPTLCATSNSEEAETLYAVDTRTGVIGENGLWI